MSMLSKVCFRFFLCFAFTLFIIPIGSYAENTKSYQVAQHEEVSISIPQDWILTDKNVTDDNALCLGLGITAEQFKEQFFQDGYYMLAYDPESGTVLRLYIEDSSFEDFSELCENKVQLSEGHDSIQLEDGTLILYNDRIALNYPYYKMISKNNNMTYYYDTDNNGNLYLFTFSVENEKYNTELEKEYDAIIGSTNLEVKNTEQELAYDNDLQAFRFDDCYLFMKSEYVYAKREDEDMDTTEQFMFEHNNQLQAIVYYDGFCVDVISYPRKHRHALSDNECVAEILTYADGGFTSLSNKFTVYALKNNCFLIQSRDDVWGANVEYISVYYFHRNGIVEITSNRKFVSDAEREKLLDFMQDITESIWPLEEMPQPTDD